MKLRVGYVPEHFSTPLFFAKDQGYYKENGLDIEFIPFPSGSGHLIQSLKDKSIDVSIGLTEAFVAGIGKGAEWYKIVGTYVESPLCWAISTGIERTDIKTVDDLKEKTIGISRIGSGSYVMPFVLAQQKGWGKFKFEIHDNFANLRDGVNHKGTVAPSDGFMWEIFTTKKYYDNGEIKNVGKIYTPWSSWVISASTDLTSNTEGRQCLAALATAINKGIGYFNSHPDEAVNWISSNLDYSAEDAKAWLATVKFNPDVSKVDENIIVNKTIEILQAAEVLDKAADSKVYLTNVHN